MLKSCLSAEGEILLFKLLVNLNRRLAHHHKSIICTMLGRNLKLTRNVMRNKLTEEGIVVIVDKVIKANTRSYKHLFDTRKRLYLTKKMSILAVINLKVLTGSRSKALAILTNTVFKLSVARGITEVGSRTAYVMNIALEIGHFCNDLCLGDNTLLASRANLSTLMECKGAEVTGTEATAVVSKRKLNLGYSGNAARRIVIGMKISCIRKCVNRVKLLPLKGWHRRILHKHFITVILDHSLAVYRIGVFVLHRKCLGIGFLIGLKCIVITDLDCIKVNGFTCLGKVNAAAHVTDLLNGNTLIKKLGNTAKNILAHAVGENVGARVNKDAATNSVLPIIVMGKSTKRCLKAADNDRNITVCLADTVTVNNSSSVGAKTHLATGRVIVIGTAFFRHGVMSHHRVDISACYKKAKSWSAKALKILGALIIGLGEYCYSEALCLKHTGDYGNAKGRVVHVSITRHVYEIDLGPISGFDVLRSYRKKIHSVFHIK